MWSSRFNEELADKVILAANRAEQLDDLGRNILDWWISLGSFIGGILYMYDSVNGCFTPLCWQNYPDENPTATIDYNSNKELFDRLFGERVFLSGCHDVSRKHIFYIPQGSAWSLTMPIMCKEEKVGMLQLMSSQAADYTLEDIAYLNEVLNESGFLLHRMRLMDINRRRLSSFQYLFDHLTEAMIVVNDQGNILQVNQAATRLLGKAKNELAGQPWLDLLELEIPIRFEEKPEFSQGSSFNASIKRGGSPSKAVRIGMTRYQWDAQGRMLIFIQDADTAHEFPLVDHDNIYRLIFDHASDLICVYNSAGSIIAVNPTAVELSGYAEHEVIGKSIYDFVHENQVSEVRRMIQESREPGQTIRYDIVLRNAEGAVMDFDFSTRIISIQDGSCQMIGLGRNITERKRMENNLKYMSHHDGLTGLYNRHFFDLETRRMESGAFDPVGVVICDIDGLKIVNDTRGHFAGDELLKAGARILKDSFRDGDVVARIGGDEFGVLMPGSNWNGIRAAIRRLDRAIGIYNAKNPMLPLHFSRGCAVRYARFKSLRETMGEADDRMYHNKTGQQQRKRCAVAPALNSEPGENRDHKESGA